MAYDQVGQRTEINNPDSGRTIYGYDANGNLISKSMANSNHISYAYTFNRLTDITYPQSATVHYDYGAMNEGYNRAGRIKHVSDESGDEWRQYGRLGETLREEKTVLAHTPSQQKKKYTTDYVFDSFGRMEEMTYPDGELLHYTYDNGGLLKAAWGEKEGNRYDYVKTLLYDEFGQRTHIEYGNGTKTNYAYDDKTRRLETLVTTLNAAQGSRQVQNLSYHYDLVGNVLNLANGISVPTNTALPAGPVSQSFGYDDLYQITSAQGQYGFGPGKQNTYTSAFTYDAIGNMTQKAQVNQIIQPSTTTTLPKRTNYVLNYAYGTNKPHAVTDDGTKTYTYDASGNMTGWQSKTSGQKRTIIWNEENRVKEIDDNGKATYFLYDDAGERVVKRGQYGETMYINRFYAVKNGELGTKHIFAGETRILSKLVKTPNTTTANTTATTPGSNGLNHGRGKKLGILKRLPDGTTTGVVQPIEKDEFYYHGDHLGSSNMITDTYGAVYQHLEYFPYGEEWIEEGGSHGGNLPGYKFTGKELDPETGLYYYGARYYDPILSRWISADPAFDNYLPHLDRESSNFAALGGVFNLRNLNTFGYSHQNPLKLKDPDGESATLIGAIVGGVVGAAVGVYEGKDVRGVIGSAVHGAVAGALVGSVIDTGGASLGVMVAAGALSNAAGGAAERIITGEAATARAVATDLITGAAGAALGEVTGKVGSAIVNKFTSAAAKSAQVTANRVAGLSAEAKIAARFPGARTQIVKQTSLGPRRLDILTEGGKAIESKVGRTSLTSSIKRQITKDVELMADPKSGISSVEWNFTPSKVTGLGGPTGPLRLELEKAGITVIE